MPEAEMVEHICKLILTDTEGVDDLAYEIQKHFVGVSLGKATTALVMALGGVMAEMPQGVKPLMHAAVIKILFATIQSREQSDAGRSEKLH